MYYQKTLGAVLGLGGVISFPSYYFSMLKSHISRENKSSSTIKNELSDMRIDNDDDDLEED